MTESAWEERDGGRKLAFNAQSTMSVISERERGREGEREGGRERERGREGGRERGREREREREYHLKKNNQIKGCCCLFVFV